MYRSILHPIPTTHICPWILPLLAMALLSLSGCASKLQSSLIEPLINDLSTATAHHRDIDLVIDGLPSFLLLLDGLIENNPQNKRLLLKASEAYASYAILVEIDDTERARQLYQRAKEYGLRALSLGKKRANKLQSSYTDFTQFIDALENSDLPAAFWTASSWGAWISTSGESMSAIAELPKVIELMRWVLAQDETFQHGSPHIFLGVYHSTLPQSIGGDPQKALWHFDQALAISKGQMLMVYVLKAEYYARQIFDQAMYESLLNKVLDTPADLVPKLTLQNIGAQKKARILLAQTNDFF